MSWSSRSRIQAVVRDTGSYATDEASGYSEARESSGGPLADHDWTRREGSRAASCGPNLAGLLWYPVGCPPKTDTQIGWVAI
jgi:hypothetical protein